MKTHTKITIMLVSLILLSLISNAETIIEVNEGELVNLKIKASDVDADEITYTFDEPLDKDGKWQTVYGDYGEYDVRVTASDGTTETTNTIKLIVKKSNWPPTLEAIEDVTLKEGEILIIEPQVKDEENDKITLTISEPIGNDGVWEVGYEDSGEYVITITATDNMHDPISEEFLITVNNANRDPEVIDFSPDEENIKINEGEKETFFLDVNDEDKDELNYKFELDGVTVSEDKAYTFETNFESVGDYTIKGTVSDGKVVMGVVWNVEVINKNRLPDLEIDDILVKEGDLIKLKLELIDPDGDDIAYSLSDPIGDDKEWQTTYEDAGTHEIELTISDGKDELEKEFNIIVQDVDRAPDFAPINDIELNEGETVEIKFEAEDADGDEITFSAKGLPEGAYIEENTLKYSPNKNTILKPNNWFTSLLKKLHIDDAIYSWKETSNIKIIAAGKEKTNHQKFKITVKNTNRAPELQHLEDIYVNEGDTAYISPKAIEADNDRVKFTISDPVGNDGKWETNYFDAGVYNITITAADKHESDTQTIKLYVNNMNRVPVIQKIESIEVKEGELVQIFPVVTDEDGDMIELSIDNLPEGAKFEENTFTWIPNNNAVAYQDGTATYEIKLIAKDRESTTEQIIEVKVKNVNRAPVITKATPAKSIKVYKRAPIKFEATAEDADGDKLYYTWKFGLSDELITNSSIIKRTFNTPGTRKIKLIVQDGEDQIEHTWKVEVVNTPLKTITPDPVIVQNPEPQVIVEKEIVIIKKPYDIVPTQTTVVQTPSGDQTHNMVIVYDGRTK